jgi:hypothetical protein
MFKYLTRIEANCTVLPPNSWTTCLAFLPDYRSNLHHNKSPPVIVSTHSSEFLELSYRAFMLYLHFCLLMSHSAPYSTYIIQYIHHTVHITYSTYIIQYIYHIVHITYSTYNIQCYITSQAMYEVYRSNWGAFV